MSTALRFALNHIVAPRRDFGEFAGLAAELDIVEVEIRNDLPGVALHDGTPASTVRGRAAAAGLRILTINALQRFEQWDETRAEEAAALADYARECGAAALVLCPTNSRDDHRDPERRAADLREALAGLLPILRSRGLRGLVEPLGFAECALRRKRPALDAIDAIGGGDVFALLHDTFHHFLSRETEIFPARTGLVHISGVEDRDAPLTDIRDGHRVLVGPADLIDNVGQIRALIAGGYAGPVSFEPFSDAVHRLADIAGALRASMATVSAAIAA